MKIDEALELLDGWQKQIIDGKPVFRQIADVIRDLELTVETKQNQLLIAEAALTACHSAMLGKVNPKHTAWGVLFAAQDKLSTPNDKVSDGV